MTKYRSIPETVDGIRFASRKEARRYGELKMLERAKQISGLTLQPRFPLVVKGQKICTYVGDFLYQNGKLICEDVKGYRTSEYRIKRRLFMALHPEIEHREV